MNNFNDGKPNKIKPTPDFKFTRQPFRSKDREEINYIIGHKELLQHGHAKYCPKCGYRMSYNKEIECDEPLVNIEPYNCSICDIIIGVEYPHV